MRLLIRFRQWPLLLVLASMLVAMIFVAADRFRVGSVMIALTVVLALGMRAVLSDDDAGLLAVRSKRIDLIVLGVLAAGLGLLSLWVPPPQ